MSRLDVSLQVAPPHQGFAAVLTPVGGAGVGHVEAFVFVHVARIAERSLAHTAPQRLVASVSAQMYLQAVFTRVVFTAVDARMTTGDRRFPGGVFGWFVSLPKRS